MQSLSIVTSIIAMRIEKCWNSFFFLFKNDLFALFTLFFSPPLFPVALSVHLRLFGYFSTSLMPSCIRAKGIIFKCLLKYKEVGWNSLDLAWSSKEFSYCRCEGKFSQTNLNFEILRERERERWRNTRNAVYIHGKLFRNHCGFHPRWFHSFYGLRGFFNFPFFAFLLFLPTPFLPSSLVSVTDRIITDCWWRGKKKNFIIIIGKKRRKRKKSLRWVNMIWTIRK